MGNIFSDLSKFGLGKLTEDVKIYEEESAKKKTDADAGAKAVHIVTESELLFDKTFKCPVCEEEFKTKMVRAGKTKVLGQDSDLRIRYSPLDPIKYEAIVCTNCGYAAHNKFFNSVSMPQKKLVRENISSNFSGIEVPEESFTYDQAIDRFKLALMNTIVKKGKISERAYVCLRIAWLLRGKAETLPKETEDYDKQIEDMHKEEEELLKNAYEGFFTAISKESFPICGYDESTMSYLLADLARRIGKYDASKRFVSEILTSRTASPKLKEKARDLKELLIGSSEEEDDDE